MTDQPGSAAQPRTIRAYHQPSGSVLIGVVTRMVTDARGRSFEVIPEGLLEAVVIREGTWIVQEDPDGR